MSGSELLAEERRYILHNADSLRRKHGCKYLLIKGSEVHGVYDTYNDAVLGGAELFGQGPFLVRSADRPEDPIIKVPRFMLAGGIVGRHAST